VISAFSSAVLLTADLRSASTLLFVKKKSTKKNPKGIRYTLQKVIREVGPSVRVSEIKIAMELVVPTNVSIHNQISSSGFRE